MLWVILISAGQQRTYDHHRCSPSFHDPKRRQNRVPQRRLRGRAGHARRADEAARTLPRTGDCAIVLGHGGSRQNERCANWINAP